MRLGEIANILKAKFISGEELADIEIKAGCGCDFMSDVLTFVKDHGVLLTGLCEPQVVKTVVKMNMSAVVFIRGKMPDEETIELAKQNNIALLSSHYRMFVACGLLFSNGLAGGDTV